LYSDDGNIGVFETYSAGDLANVGFDHRSDKTQIRSPRLPMHKHCSLTRGFNDKL